MKPIRVSSKGKRLSVPCGLPSSRFRGFCCRGDGFFCGCRLIFFCFMMLRLNGLLYGFTDGSVPALRNPPSAFDIAVYIEFMFHDYTK